MIGTGLMMTTGVISIFSLAVNITLYSIKMAEIALIITTGAISMFGFILQIPSLF
jgi:hypothetical protein